ncbi:hypothetical protein GQR58_007502 [Nymphon striatum]|nr:hypothetical protein GQR58_007502 [Nymphon striatum]
MLLRTWRQPSPSKMTTLMPRNVTIDDQGQYQNLRNYNIVLLKSMSAKVSEMCQPAKFNDSEELIDVPEEADDNNIFLMAGALERSADGEDVETNLYVYHFGSARLQYNFEAHALVPEKLGMPQVPMILDNWSGTVVAWEKYKIYEEQDAFETDYIDAVPSVFANSDPAYNAVPEAEKPSKTDIRKRLVQELLSRDIPDPTPSLEVLDTITIKQEMHDPPIGNESLGDLTRCCTCRCFQIIPDMPDPTPSLNFMDTIMIKQEMQDPPIGNESPGDLTRCCTCRCSKTPPDKPDPIPSPDVMDTIIIKQEKQDPASSPDVMDAVIIKQEMQDPPIGNESPGDRPLGYSYRWSDPTPSSNVMDTIIIKQEMQDPAPSPDVMDAIIIKQEMKDPTIGNDSLNSDLPPGYSYRWSDCVSDIPDPTPSLDVMDTIIIKQEMQDPPIGNESPCDLPPGYSYCLSPCVSGKCFYGHGDNQIHQKRPRLRYETPRFKAIVSSSLNTEIDLMFILVPRLKTSQHYGHEEYLFPVDDSGEFNDGTPLTSSGFS